MEKIDNNLIDEPSCLPDCRPPENIRAIFYAFGAQSTPPLVV
jgi:hypothetical protein